MPSSDSRRINKRRTGLFDSKEIRVVFVVMYSDPIRMRVLFRVLRVLFAIFVILPFVSARSRRVSRSDSLACDAFRLSRKVFTAPSQIDRLVVVYIGAVYGGGSHPTFHHHVAVPKFCTSVSCPVHVRVGR